MYAARNDHAAEHLPLTDQMRSGPAQNIEGKMQILPSEKFRVLASPPPPAKTIFFFFFFFGGGGGGGL